MKTTKALILCLLAFTVTTYVSAEMRFILNIFSNGAKAPSQEFVNNINEDRFGERWEEPNELTAIGMRQQFLLGSRNRAKYTNFLSETYDPKEVQIKAQVTNSTLMSAEAHLQGLYPQGTGPNLSGYQRNIAYPPQGKTGYGTFNQEAFGAPALPYNTQVFPVGTFSEKEYENFFMYNIKGSCQPMYYQIIDNQRNNETQNWLSDFASEYGARLQRAIGFSDVKILEDYHYTQTLLKDFVSDYVEGKLLKRLTDNGINLKDFNETATEFLQYDLYSVKNSGEEPMMPEIVFSTFADQMEDWMDTRLRLDQQRIGYETFDEETESFTPKMVLYSVESDVIAAILKYLQLNLSTKIYYVPYASSLYFELKRPDGKDPTTLTEFDYFVDIVFNDIPLKTISYAEFRNKMDDSWGTHKRRWECSLSPWEFWGYRNAAVTLGVLLGAVVILIIIFLICWCCCRNSKSSLNEDHHPHAEVRQE